MRVRSTMVLAATLLSAGAAPAQEQSAGGERDFRTAAATVQRQLEEAVAELARLRDEMAAETIPRSRSLADLEAQLISVRLDYQQASRLLDSRTLDLTNLRNEIKSRAEETLYLSNLLGEYIRNFDSRLHIVERRRYQDALEAAQLAPENAGLTDAEVFAAQAGLVSASLDRLFDALGGASFEGAAVGAGGRVTSGTFVLVGPAAIFLSDDRRVVGTAEERLNSVEPALLGFEDPLLAAAATELIINDAGSFPLDPTLGNAHKIAATEETLWEHIRKGGTVMVPIFALAAAALLVSLHKWIALIRVRAPAPARIRSLLSAIAARDEKFALKQAHAIGGPVGRMLAVGVEHLHEPRELIEETMYEEVLTSRLRLQRFLPFIAICAASAPLLGLLGTVTGIINTFKLITVFGSGDVKTLSGGISEALITTEYGLIVAIPSLLLHAYLSRRARGVIDQMEKAAVALVNQIAKTPPADAEHAAPTDVPDLPGSGESPTSPASPSAVSRAIALAPDPAAVRFAAALPDRRGTEDGTGAGREVTAGRGR